MIFDETRDCPAEDCDFDDRLRLALTEDSLDTSRLLTRVRHEMLPLTAPHRHSFRRSLWGTMAAALLVATVSAVLSAVPRPVAPIAADAACDHYDEVVRSTAKRWSTSQAEAGLYVRRHFPLSRDLVGSLTPPGTSFEKVGTCRLQDLRFAHFVYRSGMRRVSVFVRLSEPGERPLPRFDHHDDRYGLQVAGFHTPRYEGLIVCTLAPGPTRGVADSVARRLSLPPQS